MNCNLTLTVEVGVELNLPWRMGVGQEAELSVPNSQQTNMGKAIKPENRGGTTSNLPKDPLALSRGWERHKG
jgi:hypothetical protein